MPNPRTLAIGAAVVAGVVFLAWVLPKLALTFARSRALSRCAALEAQRAASPGADPTMLAQLDAQIRTCQQEAASLGADVDLGEVALKACLGRVELIDREFNAYKATAQEDVVQRNNKRQSILHFGSEMVRCFDGAVSDSESLAAIDTVRRGILVAIAKSEARSYCFDDGHGNTTESGCSRYGVNEASGGERAVDEANAISRPLRVVLARATTKRDELRAAQRVTDAAQAQAAANAAAERVQA